MPRHQRRTAPACARQIRDPATARPGPRSPPQTQRRPLRRHPEPVVTRLRRPGLQPLHEALAATLLPADGQLPTMGIEARPLLARLAAFRDRLPMLIDEARSGLADLTVVKANQLMPKPAHLTWEESAVNALCNSTSYRMLVSDNAARMKQGDIVLIWGATGGIGAYATQYVLNGGGIPVCVVSNAEKAQILRNMGVEHIIDRAAAGYQFWKDEHTHDESEWRRLGKDIRDLCGEDPDIVFEHPGRSTFAASMYVAKRGGTVVTCAATSGFMMEFDNRHFWMRLKNLVGSHFANYKEAWEANRLISKGMIHPVLSQVFPLDQTGEAAFQVHHNMHEGKIGVLALSPALIPEMPAIDGILTARGVIRSAEHAFSQDGGLAVLSGNIARDGCIVKTAGVDESILKFNGKARVFESQDAAVLGNLCAGEVIGHIGPRPAVNLRELATAAGLKV